MLDLAEIGNAGDFQSLYEDLKNPACLNRMDKNENIELINDDGFGAASTQYLWRFSEYHGKLLIGTFDIATLASGFTDGRRRHNRRGRHRRYSRRYSGKYSGEYRS